MLVQHRLAIAGVITATAIALPVAALASGPGAPSGKPAPPQSSAPSPAKSGAPQSAPPQLTALAASAGISVSQLRAGLVAAKQAGGSTPAGIAAFAASTGVSPTTAERVLAAVFGAAGSKAGKQGNPSGQTAMVNALAARLGVSHDAARHALDQLEALGRGGVDPASQAFAAIVSGLGVTPAQLAAALDAAKMSLASR